MDVTNKYIYGLSRVVSTSIDPNLFCFTLILFNYTVYKYYTLLFRLYFD